MLLHVDRDRAGRRRLREIAVLRPAAGGRVCAAGAWDAERGMTADIAHLRRLLDHRVRG